MGVEICLKYNKGSSINRKQHLMRVMEQVKQVGGWSYYISESI